MLKKTLMVAFGAKPGDDADDEISEESTPESAEDSETDVDDDIDTALDPKQDAVTRREAFRRAVRACSGEY